MALPTWEHRLQGVGCQGGSLQVFGQSPCVKTCRSPGSVHLVLALQNHQAGLPAELTCVPAQVLPSSHGSSSLVLLAASGEWLTEVRVWAGRTCSRAGGDGGSPVAIVSPAL